MHPSVFARQTPDKPAIIMAETGVVVSYRELDAGSNRAAHLFRSLGLRPGDVIGVYLGNNAEYFSIVWGAQRAGLLFVCISSKLTNAEVDYILEDSGCRLILVQAGLPAVAGLSGARPNLERFTVGTPVDGFRSWDVETAEMPSTPIMDETAGSDMLYSSGTTGRPKGLRPALPESGDITAPTDVFRVAQGLFGFNVETVYLCPAPLYHAAPLRWSMTIHRVGGTLVLMERFDAELALKAIEWNRVTHSQWVPTHFIRMLKLPDERRLAYDLSSQKCVIHAAAPCPEPVKRRMIDWWGPILFEYYAGTEANGMTLIDTKDWLAHPGSVGRAATGILHICDDEGNDVSTGELGTVYFENGTHFSYHNDPQKTAEAVNSRGWSTLGDVGRLDEQGYLYLADRKSFMIISGGVNIYPQEIENVLVEHPAVADVAVIGGPDEEMGERVIAVVQLMPGEPGDECLAEALKAWVRAQLSAVKVPRQIDFRESLPRHDTGKLFKRLLRDEYWKAPTSIQ